EEEEEEESEEEIQRQDRYSTKSVHKVLKNAGRGFRRNCREKVQSYVISGEEEDNEEKKKKRKKSIDPGASKKMKRQRKSVDEEHHETKKWIPLVNTLQRRRSNRQANRDRKKKEKEEEDGMKILSHEEMVAGGAINFPEHNWTEDHESDREEELVIKYVNARPDQFIIKCTEDIYDCNFSTSCAQEYIDHLLSEHETKLQEVKKVLRCICGFYVEQSDRMIMHQKQCKETCKWIIKEWPSLPENE
ncbi:hypothetical protein PFISCL1PPCAC_22881, partial [Pristionchus fissidentatus]